MSASGYTTDPGRSVEKKRIRAGVSVRSYGEFGTWDGPGTEVKATVPGLDGLIHPSYPPWDLSIPDAARVDGRDHRALERALSARGERPNVVVAEVEAR